MEVEIGGNQFSLKKVDPIRQFHLVRRMAPILNDLLPVMGSIAKSQGDFEKMSESEKFDKIAEIGKPVLDGLSKLSDADANYCLYSLLRCAQIKQRETGHWADLMGPNDTLMFPLELPILLQVAGKAFAFNLTGFFAAPPKKSS